MEISHHHTVKMNPLFLTVKIQDQQKRRRSPQSKKGKTRRKRKKIITFDDNQLSKWILSSSSSSSLPSDSLRAALLHGQPYRWKRNGDHKKEVKDKVNENKKLAKIKEKLASDRKRTSRRVTTGGPSFRNNQDNYRTRESKMWFTRKSKFQYICPWKRYKCSFCQNQKRSKPLDDYFIEILQEKTKHSTKTFDNVFEKLKQCNLMTFGPLLRL